MIENGRKELYDVLYTKDGVHKCPICEQTLFPCHDSSFICKVCGWEDDGIQYNDHDYDGGANVMSVNQYRQWWKDKQKTNE